MKFLYLFFLLFFLSNPLKSMDEMGGNKSVRIHINPLPVLDYSPRYRIGISYLNDKKLGFSLELGGGSYAMNKWRFAGIQSSGAYSFYEIRPEIQYFLKRSEWYDIYVSSEFFFLKVDDVFENQEYSNSFKTTVEFDRADFEKQKYGLHLKGGWTYYWNKRFFLDGYFGLGVASRKIGYSNLVNPITKDEFIFEEWIPQAHLYEGSTTLLHLTAGFKFGWIIWDDR